MRTAPSSTPVSKPTARRHALHMASIPEYNEEHLPHPTRPSMLKLERKLSNASCHKKLRGLTKRIHRAENMAAAQQQLRGLQRCQIQTDTGATHNLTPDRNLLLNYKSIPPMNINGVEKDTTALTAVGRGQLPVTSDEGDVLLLDCLHTPHAACTLLSPTAMCQQYSELYTGFKHVANTRNNTGYIQLVHCDGVNHTTFGLFMEDNLWWHYAHEIGAAPSTPIVRRLSSRAEFELWHHRLGHPNPQAVAQAHKYCKGVPKLQIPAFYQCASCMAGKIKKQVSKPTKSAKPQPIQAEERIHPGQHLHMDFGFVRGTAFRDKDEQGRTITSIDGFRSYLIIVDRATRYKWVFLTTTKHPPIAEIETVLKKFQPSVAALHTTVRTDQGGELGKSKAFQDLIKKYGYAYTPTGTNSSKQNGLAEKPNQDLKRMTRCLLHAANLSSAYWSYAFNHAVYLSNRTYHSAIKMTPYQALRRTQPDLSHLRVFGARCNFTHTRTNQGNMDIASDTGIFLGFTATNKNVYVLSDTDNKVHIETHKTFDEAHMTMPAAEQPPLAKALLQAGYSNQGTSSKDIPLDPATLHVKVVLLTEHARPPTRSTPDSAGLDLYCPSDIVIEPNSYEKIATDIAIQPMPGTYGQIAARSSFATKDVSVLGGVIDRDYTGNIFVVMRNSSSEPFSIHKGDRFAQIIFKKIWMPTVEVVPSLNATSRGDQGFGSTEVRQPPKLKSTPPIPIPPPTEPRPTDTAPAAAAAPARLTEPVSVIEFSDNPYDNEIDITIDVKGDHPTLGLDVQHNKDFDRLQLLACSNGTPAGKIQRWRSTLRNAFIIAVNGNEVPDITTLKRLIRECRSPQIKVTFGTMEKQAMHPQSGVPNLYFDQLHHIGQHLFTLRHDVDWVSDEIYQASVSVARPGQGVIPKGKRRGLKLTRRKLIKQDDWNEWKTSEHKQLNQYEAQQTFGQPCAPPPNSNILPLLWTYLIKDDGTKKARCVCNGAPSKKGSVTLGATYAASLEQTGARIFWAAAALSNFRVYGADVSNAFAEAPPPKAPLFVTIDTQYHEWNAAKGRPPIPKDHVLPVQGALQGHPESPRLWAILINDLLVNKLKFKPTTHEPCLYRGEHNGHKLLFLRQVDDFAIACDNEEVATAVIDEINTHMSVQIKYLGLLTRFNGVDIQQTSDYIKIHNSTYVDKIMQGHKSWMDNRPCHNMPIPMKSETTYATQLENAIPPQTDYEKRKLSRTMGFNYRQVIGELIYAMVTCRPDISFPLIKLSQYSSNPAKEHYEAAANILYYLRCTKHEGIHFWRHQRNEHLPRPDHSFDVESDACEATIQDNAYQLKTAVDADWGGDTTHRRSVTGFVIKLAGGAIYYKTRFQDVVALSSTEAEFAAAVDAGKAILYVRTILDQLNIPQLDATVLHIDNNGALNMANQQQPTRRTRHVDIKHFALQDWVERDLLVLRRITTSDNYSDALTKVVGRTLYYHHFNYIMGRLRPSYANFIDHIPEIHT